MSENAGMTLPTLDLDRGFYRTSAESQNVLKCHQKKACTGGVDTSQYCATGYQGACMSNPAGVLPGFCIFDRDAFRDGFKASSSSAKKIWYESSRESRRPTSRLLADCA